MDKGKYAIECKDGSGRVQMEFQSDHWIRATRQARQLKKDHSTVHLRLQKGFRHGKPTRWRFNREQMSWIPISWYDQSAVGKTPPKAEHPLFA